MRARCLTLAAIAALGLSGCGRGDQARIATTPVVTVIHPQRGEAIDSITLPGDLVGFYEAALHAKVTGYLKTISVDKGDWVKQGQVLAEIEVPELQQRLARARANLTVQRTTYERVKRVWESDHRLVAREDVDIAEGKYQEAKAAADELGTMVGYTRIIAPFDGVVTARFVDPGALIRAGGEVANANEGSTVARSTTAPVITVAMMNKLRVYVYMPEREVGMVKRGQPATLTLLEYPGRTFTGAVTRFATSLDLSTRTMLTEVDLENPQHLLYPGMYANVTLDLVRHPDALKLPPSAIQESSNAGAFVYAVRDGEIQKLHITTGITNGREIEVTSGLTGNEEIVSTMNPALAEGAKVRTQPLAPAIRAFEKQIAGAH